jgi:hypothetical protein
MLLNEISFNFYFKASNAEIDLSILYFLFVQSRNLSILLKNMQLDVMLILLLNVG